MAVDPRFATNPARLENRNTLNVIVEPMHAAITIESINTGLEAVSISVGPVNTLDQVFRLEQVTPTICKLPQQIPRIMLMSL